MTTMNIHFSVCVMVLGIIGIVVNSFSLAVLIIGRRRSHIFHNLLKILAVYDLIVVIGCGLLYALPSMRFRTYTKEIFPSIMPWLLPVVQIALMSSIYCTVIMSFERYIRICHICQLRDCSYITRENFK